MSVNEKHMWGFKYSGNACKATFQSTWVRFPGLFLHMWNQRAEPVSVDVWPFMPFICVCCERPPSAAAPSSLKNQSFTWSKTHSRTLTLYRFQEPLFTPAPEETPWKKEPQAAKKHTKQQGKTVPNLIKVEKSSRTTAHLFRECPQSRRVNKTQYLLDLWANNHYLLRVDEWRIILCKPHK